MWFGWSVINNLSNISFNVFMWHYPLLLIMYVVLKLFDISINLCSAKTMIVFTIICYFIGTLPHYLIERPINKLLDCKLSGWK